MNIILICIHQNLFAFAPERLMIHFYGGYRFRKPVGELLPFPQFKVYAN